MSHQKGRLKNSKFWLCLSLILCLVSAIVASAVQTSGGIRIKEMSWESPSGHQLAAYLYIPQNATKDTPAPGVVTIEGWYNNKEMQDLYWQMPTRISASCAAFSLQDVPCNQHERLQCNGRGEKAWYHLQFSSISFKRIIPVFISIFYRFMQSHGWHSPSPN